MLTALAVSALVAGSFVSAPLAAAPGSAQSLLHRSANGAPPALWLSAQALRFQLITDSDNGRSGRLVALGSELAQQQEQLRRWKRTTVLSIVYLSVGPVLWILGAAATSRWGPNPAFAPALGTGIGFTIVGGIFLPLSIVLARKAAERIKEIEVEIEVDERGYEFGAREAPLRAPGIVVPLIAVRF